MDILEDNNIRSSDCVSQSYYSGIKIVENRSFRSAIHCGETADFYFPALSRLLIIISKREWLVPFFLRRYRGRRPLLLCECRIDGIACVPSIIYLPIAGDLAPGRPAILTLVIQVIDRSHEIRTSYRRILTEKYYYRNCFA